MKEKKQYHDKKQYRNGFTRFFLKNHHYNLKFLLSFLLVILFGASVFTGLVISKKLSLIKIDRGDDGLDFDNADESVTAEEESLNFDPMYDVSDANSLNDWLLKWATNGGEKMYSKNIINCLLCGVDSKNGAVSDGRSDAMILVSLNKKTKEITLLSFMRDAYTYMNINGENRYYKVNSTFNWGGPATLVNTLENNYKIEIDNYICVDFKTFPKLIDALGGVTVEVQPYEANYINRTSSCNIESGEAVTLSGKEALVFSRIRHSDSDGDFSRTRRQRLIITALIKSAQNASAGQLNNMMNIVLPYVRTNYTRRQIVSYATQALMQGWLKYNMTEIVTPVVDPTETDPVVTGKDSYIRTGYGYAPEFVWIVDYQLAAHRIQTALYGMSNIEINDSARTSPFDFMTSKSGSSSYDDDYYYTTRSSYGNYNYDNDGDYNDNTTTTSFLRRFFGRGITTEPDRDNDN
ncbi:MAG: LCP family protein, partial [Clostridiales bacterium]|nr:LCP family protein [Clostridiales bacterium]